MRDSWSLICCTGCLLISHCGTETIFRGAAQKEYETIPEVESLSESRETPPESSPEGIANDCGAKCNPDDGAEKSIPSPVKPESDPEPDAKPRKADSEGVIFITSAKFSGNFGNQLTPVNSAQGRDAADILCTQLANKGNLPGAFRAILSDSTGNAVDRFANVGKNLVLPNGDHIASSITDLFGKETGPLASININEKGERQIGMVWTGSSKFGLKKISGTGGQRAFCKNWTIEKGEAYSLVGENQILGAAMFDKEPQHCSKPNHLYCVGVPLEPE